LLFLDGSSECDMKLPQGSGMVDWVDFLCWYLYDSNWVHFFEIHHCVSVKS